MSDTLEQMVCVRYKSTQEIAKYRQRANSGLLAWELTITRRYLSTPGRLMDIGCGCGREAFPLAQLGHEITAVDICAEQLEIARGMAREHKYNIRFQVVDGNSYPFRQSHFDYVVIWSQVLGNVPGGAKRLSMLKECHALLRAGGTIALSVHNRDVCEPLAIQKGIVLDPVGLALEDGDFIEKDAQQDTPCYWHYFRKGELTDLIENVGFQVVECDLATAFGQTGWDSLFVAVGRKPL